jgi:hypothetical protein
MTTLHSNLWGPFDYEHIGTLREEHKAGWTREYQVMLWGDYGFVCPDLCTTNGNLSFLLRCIRDEMTWEPATVEVTATAVEGRHRIAAHFTSKGG